MKRHVTVLEKAVSLPSMRDVLPQDVSGFLIVQWVPLRPAEQVRSLSDSPLTRCASPSALASDTLSSFDAQ